MENPAETNNGLEVVFQIGEVKGALHRALKLAKDNGTFNGTVVDVKDDEVESEGSYRSLAVINLLMHLVCIMFLLCFPIQYIDLLSCLKDQRAFFR